MIRLEQLVGHWKLVSFVEQGSDGQWFNALGPGIKGCISYWPTGHMQVINGTGDRPRLSGTWASVPDADKAQCLDRMVAYSGRFTIQGERLLHHVEVCWIPNWEGRDLVRLPSFPAPNQLLLCTEGTARGRPQPQQQVLWERVA